MKSTTIFAFFIVLTVLWSVVILSPPRPLVAAPRPIEAWKSTTDQPFAFSSVTQGSSQ